MQEENPPLDTLQSFAEHVCARRLEVPVIFLLELFKPFTTMARASIVLSQPLFGFLIGDFRKDELLRLLEKRENVEELILCIERTGERFSA